MSQEHGISRSQIVNQLSASFHGDLAQYAPIIGEACRQDPEFLAHLIAFDAINGQVKDSKVALPILTAASREYPLDFLENSLAHMAMLPPRELLRALRFSISLKSPASRQRAIERTIRRYLFTKESEPGKWARLVARHRRPLKSLYALTRAKSSEFASKVLFGGEYAPGSIFADIAGLKHMDEKQAAAAIEKWHLSPLVVTGAMAGSRAKQDAASVVQATMNQMSDTELVTRAKSLEKKGVGKDSTLKETFRKKVAKATKSNKATLKTAVAAEEVEDESLRTMLKELQERQIQTQKDAGRGIDGNWLVISDRSSSQEEAINLGKHIAAAIAKFVTGKVWLAFCAEDMIGYDVTGKTLEQITEKTKFIIANGSTSYGVGLEWAASQNLDLHGVVIVGDGGENSAPMFAHAHARWEMRTKVRLPVYLYQTYCPPRFAMGAGGDPRQFAQSMARQNIEFTTHDLTHGKVDYYSIPNLVQQMNVNRFGVVERIMACPLVTLDQVLPVGVGAATSTR